MSKALSLFIPITKIDEEQRLVYGRIAAEELDNSGELFDYETSKPNFEKWSNDQFEASGGLSKGNVRAMHGPIAAGMLTDISFDDDNRIIEGCAKIVDDNEWRKCLAGVYTGFSMGGRYERRWNDNGVRKYTALPAEVSIVDKPCIKSARFDGLLKCDLVKADGTVEEMELGKAWDESKHPRHPKGSEKGGEFASLERQKGETRKAHQKRLEGQYPDSAKLKDEIKSKLGDNYATGINPDGSVGAFIIAGSEDEIRTSLGEGFGVEAVPDNMGDMGRAFRVSRSGSTWASRIAGASEETRGLYNRVYESAAKAGWDNVDRQGNSAIEEAISWAATQLEPTDDFETWDATVQSYLEDREAGVDPTAEKSDKGDQMYEPTNDEMLARAQTLAKAAGKTDADWLDFKDAAVTELKAEHEGKDLTKADAPEHTDEDCKVGEGCEKCAGMTKADNPDADNPEADGVTKADLPELSQGWRAKDGSFHLKKADALAHNESVGAGPTLADQLSGLREDLGKSDADPVEAALAVIGKMDEAQFEKFVTTEDTPLRKYIDDAITAARAQEKEDLTKADAVLMKVDDPAVAEKLAKVDTLTEENEVLNKKVGGLEKQLADAAPLMEELRKDIAAIKAMPIPGGPAATDTTRVVDKSQDRGALSTSEGTPLNKGTLLDQLQKSIASGELKAEDVADAAIRAAQNNGTRIAL